jgi:hypothetical protein
MGTRIFAHAESGAQLISDERDIAVDCRKRTVVWSWCAENNIVAEYQGTRFGNLFGLDMWRVKNDQDRILFLLRWQE